MSESTALATPIERMQRSFDGLRLGDCFGQQMFVEPTVLADRAAARRLPPGPWWYTDDTAQAAILCEHLARRGTVHPDELARELADEHAAQPMRGYGAGARTILRDVAAGVPWQVASRGAFAGMGSMGNGAAMRVAPLGAYLADDLPAVVEEARRSAEVTHANVNGISGAIATAIAASLLSRGADREGVWAGVLEGTPTSITRDFLLRGADASGASVRHAAAVLGVGERICAHDTVPFAIWMALNGPSSFSESMWETASMGGDRDTTCAIVGGLIACRSSGVFPAEFRERAETRILRVGERPPADEDAP